MSGILCAGNWIVDHVHSLESWPAEGELARITSEVVGIGGGAANVATDLVSLGFPHDVEVAGMVGDDRDGHYLRQHCTALGLNASGLHITGTGPTAHTHVMSVKGRSRTFFYNGGANDLFGAEIDAVLPRRTCDVFYLGYLMLLRTLDTLGADGTSGAARLLARASEMGMTTCVDLVSSNEPTFQSVVRSAMPHCDYAILNEVEVGRATGVCVRDAVGELRLAEVRRAAMSMLAQGVRKAVIVHMPEGALCCQLDGQHWERSLPLDPSEIASSVGAGDAFCAAVLYGIHEHWPIDRTLRAAHRAAHYCLKGATATDNIPQMKTLVDDEASTELY